MSFKLVDLVGSGFFGMVGFAAFIYGKKESSFKIMMIAAALMAYPLLVTGTVGIYVVGAALTAALFIFKD